MPDDIVQIIHSQLQAREFLTEGETPVDEEMQNAPARPLGDIQVVPIAIYKRDLQELQAEVKAYRQVSWYAIGVMLSCIAIMLTWGFDR